LGNLTANFLKYKIKVLLFILSTSHDRAQGRLKEELCVLTIRVTTEGEEHVRLFIADTFPLLETPHIIAIYWRERALLAVCKIRVKMLVSSER